MKDYIATEKVAGVQFTQEDAEKVERWCGGTLLWTVDENAYGNPILLFDSAGTNGFVLPGGWIVRDEDGDFYGYSDEDFKDYYTIAGWHKE